MPNNENISVAMATYNGEKYIKEQIDSILQNMNEFDELVISDDGSTDDTVKIIKNFQKKDNRIKFFDGPRLGVKKNFENAILNTKNKYIFLSDQDDIWKKDKVKKVLKCFKERKCDLIVHDAVVFDDNTNANIYNSFFVYRNSGKGVIKNIYKNTYIGCCMAFDRKYINKIIPIPNDIEMHDQWIGIIIDKFGKSYFLDEKLIKYRRHKENVSVIQHYPFKKMLKNRIVLIKNLLGR